MLGLMSRYIKQYKNEEGNAEIFHIKIFCIVIFVYLSLKMK